MDQRFGQSLLDLQRATMLVIGPRGALDQSSSARHRFFYQKILVVPAASCLFCGLEHLRRIAQPYHRKAVLYW